MSISTTTDIKNLAESFQAVGVGIAALFSAITFAPVLEKIVKKKTLISKYRKLYPVSELGKNYKLVHHPHRGRGHVYLIDIRSKTTHHVENMGTMKDLDFDWGVVQDITADEYDKFTPANNIDTQVD